MTPIEEACAGIIAAVAERHRVKRYTVDGILLRPVPNPDAYFADDSWRVDMDSALWSSIRCASLVASGVTPRFPRA